MKLLDGVEILQSASPDACSTARRSIDFAGQMARLMGASVSVDDQFQTASAFLSRGKTPVKGTVDEWIGAEPGRILLMTSPCVLSQITPVSTVHLKMSSFENEATLFGASGLADLLGDPDRAPLIPDGDFAAGTIGYGVFAALCGVAAKWRRFEETDTAIVDGVGVLSWVNWKAAMAGEMGRDIHRQGGKAEWPIIECADGHVALVYTERDWQPLVDLVNDDRLRNPRFDTFRGRRQYREEYMGILREWAIGHKKAELVDLFAEYQVPAAPVMTAEDLLLDPLLAHRDAFVNATLEDGADCRSPVLAHRIPASTGKEAVDPKISHASRLPLSGFRVLDLGIITAGAGVSAFLADLGAEVLKIESHDYPDPFRAWAGEEVSPFFKGNNRNKLGVALDLKSGEDRAQFEALVKTADVVVENFRRGVLDRLGYSYETLSTLNPDIILASVSGIGLTGPGANNSSFGSTLEASSGFSAKVRYESEGLPYITGRNVNYPDQTVVLYAGAVITAALSGRARGMHIDVSQRDVTVFLSGEELEVLSAGKPLTQRRNGLGCRTADDQWIVFDDSQGVLRSEGSLTERIAEMTATDCIEFMNSRGVSACVAWAGSDMYRANIEAGNDVFATSPNGDLVKGFPFQLLNTPLSIYRDSPMVGEHTEQILSQQQN